MLIKQNKFNEIQNFIFILRDIRNVDRFIIEKTADRYINLVSKLKNDISGKSVETISEILKKIKQDSL